MSCALDMPREGMSALFVTMQAFAYDLVIWPCGCRLYVAMSRPGPVNRQRVVQVTYIHRYNVIELTYDDVYQAIGCLAQVENPKAHPWHEKTRYLTFYVLPCPKSMRYEYFSSIFASKPQSNCPMLENSKTYSHFSHRICEDCFNELVSQSSGSLDCYCLALGGQQPESNHTKKLKGKPLKQIALSKKEKVGRSERRQVDLTEEKLEVELTEEKLEAEIVEEGTEENKEDYLKRISELEEKLKDLEEDVDAGHDLVSQLTISHIIDF